MAVVPQILKPEVVYYLGNPHDHPVAANIPQATTAGAGSNRHPVEEDRLAAELREARQQYQDLLQKHKQFAKVVLSPSKESNRARSETAN